MAAIASAGQPLHRGAPSSSRTIFEQQKAPRVTDAAIVLGRGLDRATTWTRQKPSKTGSGPKAVGSLSRALPDDKRRTDPPRDRSYPT